MSWEGKDTVNVKICQLRYSSLRTIKKKLKIREQRSGEGASWEYQHVHSGSPGSGEKEAEEISVDAMALNFPNMVKNSNIHLTHSTNCKQEKLKKKKKQKNPDIFSMVLKWEQSLLVRNKAFWMVADFCKLQEVYYMWGKVKLILTMFSGSGDL